MNGPLLVGTVLLSVCGGFALIFLFAILPRLTKMKDWAPDWLVFWSGAVAFALLVAGLSFMGEANQYALFAYALVVLVLVGVFAYSFYLAFRLDLGFPLPDGLADLWNVRKGFGGNVFGDTVGVIGVLSGIGAYQVSGQSEGWLWFAIFANLAALLIGLSQVQRGVIGHEVQNDPNPGDRPFKTDWEWDPWAAFFTLSISSITLLSLMVHTSETNSPVREWWLKAPLLALYLIIIALLVVFAIRYRRAADADTPKLIIAAWVLTFIFVVGAFALLWVFQFVDLPDTTIISLAGVAGGMAAILEVINIIRIVKDTEDTSKGYKIERSVFIIIGLAAATFLTIWVGVNHLSSFDWWHWMIFGIGVALSLIGVLIGIQLGINSILSKRAERVKTRPRSNAFSAPSRRLTV